MIVSVRMLQYRLLEGPVGLEPLRILASRCREWQGWQVTFIVLGTSHAVRLERDGVILTELLTCALPEGGARVLAEREGDRPESLCLHARGLQCRARLTPFALEEGEALRGQYPAEDRLEVPYPALPEGVVPFTRMGWRLTESELCVETVHTYPEEGRGVHSASVFTREEAG